MDGAKQLESARSQEPHCIWQTDHTWFLLLFKLYMQSLDLKEDVCFMEPQNGKHPI